MADMAAAGDIRFEIHYLPIFEATGPAIFAVECAGEQGYWWAMHNRILEDQADGIRAQKTVEELDALLSGYASELGLDMESYNRCMTSPEKAQSIIDRVNDQIAAAQDLGIRGTPTFVLNGEPLELNSFDDVVKAVRKELNGE